MMQTDPYALAYADIIEIRPARSDEGPVSTAEPSSRPLSPDAAPRLRPTSPARRPARRPARIPDYQPRPSAPDDGSDLFKRFERLKKAMPVPLSGKTRRKTISAGKGRRAHSVEIKFDSKGRPSVKVRSSDKDLAVAAEKALGEALRLRKVLGIPG